MQFMAPIFERTGFMHGRIAVPVACRSPPNPTPPAARPQAHGVANFLEHFEDMWTSCMAGFIRNANGGDVLIFATELLAVPTITPENFPTPPANL